MSEEHASVPVTEKDLAASGLPSLMKMSPGLALYFNDAIYNRVKQIAGHMSKAEGVTPRHLLGKPEACFAVATRAITWNLDPQSVAAATWQTPSGQIGYEAKLIVAIMENSGALVGRVSFEYKGDWSRLRGKFKEATSGKGNKYFVSDWPKEDEKDLSIVVRCQIKGEATPREEEFWLEELWPRNSTLWAIRPRQQATYAVSRAFANIATPGLIMGLPFDIDPGAIGSDQEMVDVTPPRPTRENEFSRSPARTSPAYAELVTHLNHANKINEVADLRARAKQDLPPDMLAEFEELCDRRAASITGSEAKKEAGKASATDVQEEGHQPESEGDPAHQDESQSEDLARGLDILSRIARAADVDDIRKTIAEDLQEAELPGWNNACDDKVAELKKAKAGKAK